MHQLFAKTLFLIQVSRPIIWPVLPLVYGLGLHAAHAPLGAAAITQMLLLIFPINLLGCGLNDIYDYESDRRSTRRRAVWGAVVDDENRSLVFRAAVAMALLIALGACLARNTANVIATIMLIATAWLYSVPPARLKERPPLDSLANGLGYFLLPFVMGYSLNADPRTMPPKYYLLALCVCGVHALATAADYDADRAAGHRTLAVSFGRRTAAAIACATFLAAWLFGDFESLAVRVYIIVCTIATLAAALLPHDRVIAGTCVTIFVGFLLAAIFHIAAH